MVVYQRETRTLPPSPIAVITLSMKVGFDDMLDDFQITSLAFFSFTMEGNVQSRRIQSPLALYHPELSHMGR